MPRKNPRPAARKSRQKLAEKVARLKVLPRVNDRRPVFVMEGPVVTTRLAKLLGAMKHHRMTEDEIRLQRESFVRGEAGLPD